MLIFWIPRFFKIELTLCFSSIFSSIGVNDLKPSEKISSSMIKFILLYAEIIAVNFIQSGKDPKYFVLASITTLLINPLLYLGFIFTKNHTPQKKYEENEDILDSIYRTLSRMMTVIYVCFITIFISNSCKSISELATGMQISAKDLIGIFSSRKSTDLAGAYFFFGTISLYLVLTLLFALDEGIFF